MPSSSPTISRGGCHCGAVAFEIRGRPERLLICNCSICTMKGYLHWFVPRDDFTLLRGDDAIATYTFNTGAARHHFCTTCGIASFYIARSHPDQIDVNARCVAELDLDDLPIDTFDGQDWEAAHERYRDRQ